MEEQTIVINDLLSFAWCKLELCSVPKERLLQCIQDFYPQKYATAALETLLLVVPNEYSNTHEDENPVKTILDVLYRLSESEDTLPVFVCKDLNNVPSIRDLSEELSPERDPIPEKALYEEHLTIKSELNELCGSLYELKQKLTVMTDFETEEGNLEHPATNQFVDFDRRGSKKMKRVVEEDENDGAEQWYKDTDVPSEDDPSYSDDDSTTDEGDAEQRTLLIANRRNRCQRLMERRAQRGEKVIKFKKFKSLINDSSLEGTHRKKTAPVSVEVSEAPVSVPKSQNRVRSPKSRSKNGGKRQASTGQASFHCSKCSFSSKGPALALNHICPPKDGSGETEPKTSASCKTYSCTYCDVTFKTVDALNIHKMSHFETDFRCPLCTKRFPEEEWLDHVGNCPGDGSTKREDHHCSACDIYFGEKKLLGYHIAYHDESRPFQCLQCKYRFYTQKAVDDHFKMHSRKDYRHKCPFCNLRTPRLTRIKEHIRCHTGDKPFECHLCEYSTTTYDTLKGHQRSHFQNSEFKCKDCGKIYNTKNKLRFHERAHSEDKPHKCPVCGKGFNYGMCMTLHYRRHLGKKTHDCPQCQFKGRTGNDLREHVLILHPQKMPYQCAKCDYGSLFKSYLKAHKREAHPRKSNLLSDETKIKEESTESQD